MLERKYLAHYIDASFDPTGATTNYVRLGDGIEEFNVEMNPEIETTNDIIGNSNAVLKSYEVSASVDPYYYTHDDALSEKLQEICEKELKGDECKTTVVDVWLKPSANGGEPEVTSASRREVIVAVQSYGGDTAGVQIPFSINGSKNKVQGDFDISTKEFTETTL